MNKKNNSEEVDVSRFIILGMVFRMIVFVILGVFRNIGDGFWFFVVM